ncbi:hypothetical protein KPL70_001145 [Citrus sinensis]|nr:hypothetical protein KPL70_001145 [Citrus sinensis]
MASTSSSTPVTLSLPKSCTSHTTNKIENLVEYSYIPESAQIKYIQSSRLDQCALQATSAEQYVTLEIPSELLSNWKREGYTHLHLGGIRLILTLHGRKGLPVTARLAMLDTQFKQYQDAVIGTVLTTLHAGSVLLTFYPNFNLSLQDPNLPTTLKVQVQIQGVEQIFSAKIATLHHQLVYRLQNHALDLPTPEHHSDTLMVLAEYDQIPTIIQIPRQIPRHELIKLMPLEWISNYEQFHNNTAPIQTSETQEDLPITGFNSDGYPVYPAKQNGHFLWEVLGSETHTDSQQNVMSKPFVPSPITSSGHLEPPKPFESVLNWQTQNARAQNDTLLNINSKYDPSKLFGMTHTLFRDNPLPPPPKPKPKPKPQPRPVTLHPSSISIPGQQSPGYTLTPVPPPVPPSPPLSQPPPQSKDKEPMHQFSAHTVDHSSITDDQTSDSNLAVSDSHTETDTDSLASTTDSEKSYADITRILMAQPDQSAPGHTSHTEPYFVDLPEVSSALAVLHDQFLGDPSAVFEAACRDYLNMKCCSLNAKDLDFHYKRMSLLFYKLNGFNEPTLKHVFLASLPDELQPDIQRQLTASNLVLDNISLGKIFQLAKTCLDKLCEQKQFFKELLKDKEPFRSACKKPYLQIKCQKKKDCDCSSKKKRHFRKFKNPDHSSRPRRSRKPYRFFRKKSSSSKDFKRRKSSRYFICKKKGHYAKDCPNKREKSIQLVEHLQATTDYSPDKDELEFYFSEQDEPNDETVFALQNSSDDSDSDQSQVIFHQQLLSLDTTVPIPSIKLQILPSKFQRLVPAIGLIYTGAQRRSHDEYRQLLTQFYDIVQNHGIILSAKKSTIATENIEFLGMIIKDGYYQPGKHIAQELLHFPDQQLSKKQVQQFLGIINYIRDFIPHVDHYTRHLSALLKKKPPKWNADHTNAVTTLKQIAQNPLPLKLITDGKRILQTDASDELWGASLLEEINGKEHFITYASGQFSDTQKHYHSVFKEILAVNNGIKKFEYHLIGHHFLIRMDSSAFPNILNFKDSQNQKNLTLFSTTYHFPIISMATSLPPEALTKKTFPFNKNFSSAFAIQEFAKKALFRFFMKAYLVTEPFPFSTFHPENLFLTGLTLDPSRETTEDVLWYIWCLTVLYATKLVLPIAPTLEHLLNPDKATPLTCILLEWFSPIPWWRKKLQQLSEIYNLERMPVSEAQLFTSVFIIHRPYFQHLDTNLFWTQDQVYEWFTAPYPAIIDNEIQSNLHNYLCQLNHQTPPHKDIFHTSLGPQHNLIMIPTPSAISKSKSTGIIIKEEKPDYTDFLYQDSQDPWEEFLLLSQHLQQFPQPIMYEPGSSSQPSKVDKATQMPSPKSQSSPSKPGCRKDSPYPPSRGPHYKHPKLSKTFFPPTPCDNPYETESSSEDDYMNLRSP